MRIGWDRCDANEFRRRYPGFAALESAIRNERIQRVYVDLIYAGPGYREHPHVFALAELGAEVLNIAEKDREEASARLREVYPRAKYFPYFYPNAATDLVAFYPALAGDLLYAFIDTLEDLPPEHAWSRLNSMVEHLRRENPYSRGDRPSRVPDFIRSRMSHEHYEAEKEQEVASRQERRRTGEQLYVLGPRHDGYLLDENVHWEKPRDADGLAFAQKRLCSMGFEEIRQDNRLSYVLRIGDFIVFGDPRITKRLEFHVHTAEPPKRRKRGSSEWGVPEYYPRTRIPDGWKNDLRAKLERMVSGGAG